MAIQESYGGNPDFASKVRENIFRVLILLLAFTYIGRLGYLQIIKGNVYRLESEAQAIKQEVVEPFRGNMFDRNGILMVHNESSYTIRITPNEFKRDRLPLLASLLGMPQSEILKALKKSKSYSIFEPVKIARDIDFKIVATIEEYNDLLPGVDIATESKRLYDFDGNMAHLLGYTREISSTQLDQKKYYRPGDVIGQSGLEYSFEEFLRGTKGIKYVAVNRSGQKVSSFDNGKSDLAVGNGFDLYLSIDKRLQEKAEQLLSEKNHCGTVVAIDPQNGEILALASKPDYDPRKFSGKIPPDLFKELYSDENHPLLNRAVQSQYPPGSTWKMLVALAALQEGIIDENTTLHCPGSFFYGGRSYKCHGTHGTVNVRQAIQKSCNVFFYQVGMKLGLERLAKYGKMFGFGEKSFIDIPNENRGFLPNPEWFKRKFGDVNPTGRMINYGIGQGEILATPLQMAVYAAALANGGTVYQPHIVRAVNNNITKKTEYFDYAHKSLPFSKHFFDIVQGGMYDVVNVPGGTGSGAKIQGLNVCGKTGTAQNPHGQDHAWFICFAPMEHPKIAMCVMVENAGYGGAVSAPIAKELINLYLNPDSTSKADLQKMPVKPGEASGKISPIKNAMNKH